VTLDGNGNPVTSSNPLPVHDGSAQATIETSALGVGELVKIMFQPYEYGTILQSGATITYDPLSSPFNPDGTNTSVTLATAAAAPLSGAALRCKFYGRVLGIRFQRNSTTPAFSVNIDGEAYDFRLTSYLWNSQTNPAVLGGTSAVDRDANLIVTSDLPDGAHDVEIYLPGDPLGVSAYSLILTGIMVERRVGYKERMTAMGAYSAGTVPTTLTIIGAGNSPNNYYHGLRKVIYTNTTAAAILVKVQIATILIWQSELAASGTAGCSDTCDPGDFVVNSGSSASFQHFAGATGVNFAAFMRAA